MPPHGVVQARHGHPGGDPAQAVPAQDGFQQRVVARVGQCRPVNLGVIGHRSEGAHPNGVPGLLGPRRGHVQRRIHVADIKGALVSPVPCHRVVVLAQQVGSARQRFRAGYSGRHLRLVFDAVVLILEGRDHRQDGHALLIRVYPAGGERAAVPEPLDAEGDRLVGIPRAQEVPVHGVHAAALGNGAAPGNQGLGEHLPAEHAVPGLLLRGPHKDVLIRPGTLKLAEVEQLEERGGGVLGWQPLQFGFGFSHGLTLDVTPAPLKRGTAGRVEIVPDVLIQPLQFTDPRDLTDLRTFATRAKSIDDGAIRLQASGQVLAAYVCVLRPRLLGESTPTILGLRTMALAQPADTDVTVPISAVLDRLARAGENDVELPLPPVTLTESWAGVGAPRSGWEAVATLPDSALRRSAEAGITEIAGIIPDKPGALIVNNARATVWGRELEGAGGLPLGAAFAALTLGFLADGGQQLYRSGRWFRLSGARGHVLARSGSGL